MAYFHNITDRVAEVMTDLSHVYVLYLPILIFVAQSRIRRNIAAIATTSSYGM